MRRRTVHATPQRQIPLGYQGENEALQVVFAVEPFEGNWALLYQRATDSDPYPVPLDVTADGLVWTVTSGDTAVNGIGRAQLICSGAYGEILKTMIYTTVVSKSLPCSGEAPPDPVKPWYDALHADFEGAVQVTQQLADMAIASADESANSARESADSSAAAAQYAHDTEQFVGAAAQAASNAEGSAASAAESATNAQKLAEQAAGHAQAMAGTFDFTGYLRYQMVEKPPEAYEEGVLYIVTEA